MFGWILDWFESGMCLCHIYIVICIDISIYIQTYEYLEYKNAQYLYVNKQLWNVWSLVKVAECVHHGRNMKWAHETH